MPRTAISNTRNTPDNLVTNGDFEYAPALTAATTTTSRWIDGTAAGTVSDADAAKYNWFTSFTGSCSAQFDSSIKYRGTTSMKVSTTATNAIAQVHSTSSDYPMLAGGSSAAGYMKIQPSTSYVVSGWMKTNYVSGDGRGAFIRVSDYTGAKVAITSYSTTSIKTTTDWTFYSFSFTTGSTSQYARVGLFVWGQDAPATLIMDAWFDDITLVKSPVQTRTAVTVEPLPIVNAGFETAPPFTAATNVNSRYIDGTAGGSVTDVGYKWKTSSCTNSEVKFDSSEKYTGNYSIKLSTLSTGAIVTVEQSYLDLSFKVKPNTNYIMTYKIKTQLNSGSSLSGAYGIMSQRNSAGTITNTNYGTSILTTTDWTQYSIRMTTYPETTYITFGVAINGTNGAGTLVMDAWFDDIEIKEVIPQRRTPDNLLSNGNFEYVPPFTAATTGVNRWIDGTATGSGNTESPYGWWTPSSFTASAAAQFDTSVYRSGTASLKLSTLNATGVANAAAGSNISRQTAEKTMVPALPNTSYTITGWTKTNNVNTNSVYIDCIEYNGTLSTVATNSTSKLSGTNDWTQLTKTFTTNANTRYLLVVLRNSVAGNVSDAWFDDITLTKVPAQTRTVVT